MLRSSLMTFPQRHLDLLNLIGYHHLQHGNAERALVIFDAMNFFRPGDLKVICSLARAYIDCKRPEQALTALDLLESQDADDPLAWLLRSQALMQAGRTAECASAMSLFIQKRKEQNS